METDGRSQKNNGIRRLYLALLSSIAGFRYIVSNEAAFRQELVLIVLAPLSVFIFSGSFLNTLIVFSAWLLVMIIEVLNTAIEVVVDRISLEHHPLSGAAKDLGSLAVLLATGHALVWWIYAL